MKLIGRAPAIVLGAAISLALVAAPAAAQWKWRDRNGQITVSDIPPPRDIPERDILERPPPPSARPAPAAAPAAPGSTAEAAAAGAEAAPPSGKPAEAPRVDPELEARRRAAEQEQSARQRDAEAKLAAQRAENCRAARGHLAALQSGQRLVRVNDKGEREFLDDRQRAAEMQRARDVIASDCR